MAARRYVVSGKVQGVFFRASAARQAEQLGIRGFARNLPDGRVEVLALGDGASLGLLADWLRRGPPLALVTAVAEHPEDPDQHSHITSFRTG
jgi:acylphosphatase